LRALAFHAAEYGDALYAHDRRLRAEGGAGPGGELPRSENRTALVVQDDALRHPDDDLSEYGVRDDSDLALFEHGLGQVQLDRAEDGPRVQSGAHDPPAGTLRLAEDR